MLLKVARLIWCYLLSGLTGGSFLKKKTDTSPASASTCATTEADLCSQSENSSDTAEDQKTELDWCDIKLLVDEFYLSLLPKSIHFSFIVWMFFAFSALTLLMLMLIYNNCRVAPKNEDIALQTVTLSIVERFSEFFTESWLHLLQDTCNIFHHTFKMLSLYLAKCET